MRRRAVFVDDEQLRLRRHWLDFLGNHGSAFFGSGRQERQELLPSLVVAIHESEASRNRGQVQTACRLERLSLNQNLVLDVPAWARVLAFDDYVGVCIVAMNTAVVVPVRIVIAGHTGLQGAPNRAAVAKTDSLEGTDGG